MLQTKLKLETSLRLVNFNVFVIDRLGMLLGAVYWPKGGTVADLINGVNNFILKYLHFADVFPIFDRYYNYCIQY